MSAGAQGRAPGPSGGSRDAGAGRPVPEILRTAREGTPLSADEVRRLAGGLADGGLTDAQVGAMAMAFAIHGLTDEGRVALTLAMRDSGDVLDWSDVDVQGPILDKHSTGGVGDKVSLLLSPIVAACGGAVPQVSGRGLGHTGGTLDKLEAIPGYDATPDVDRLKAIVAEVGCAIVGQTSRIAPADGRLYGVRDATGTVETIPLISASILSKKLAAGLDGLVLDVKCGSGAFLPDPEDSRALAETLVSTARGAGLRCSALLTDMDGVLGRTAGNGVEVAESIAHLTGAAHDPALVAVTLELAAELLVLGGLYPDVSAAHDAARRALEDGRAADRFARMVVALGGPADLLERPGSYLESAPVVVAVEATEPGVVGTVDVRAVGLLVGALGAGRTRDTDPVDPAVGLTEVAARGEQVGPGEAPLAVVHARTQDAAERATAALRDAVRVAPEGTAPGPAILGRVG
ncbi:thymidine phosphorylase [Patulibacter sp. NPDC049589]|uniref:thymidine phosphorylase n=1 Tax=Patulibacter sp. NPDC049589 TaxID=3154731 RepID=UPI003413C19B